MKNYQIVPVIAAVMLAVTFATACASEADKPDSGNFIKQGIWNGNYIYTDKLIEEFALAKDTFLNTVSQKNVFMDEASVDEAFEYLYQQIPEFDVMSSYIEKTSEGKAHFSIRIPEELTILYNSDETETIRGYYYAFYVGESHEDHTTYLDWFYVKADLTEILHENIIEAQLETLEEWRNSEDYLSQVENLSDINITDSGFIKIIDKYLITDGNQIDKLAKMVADHLEIEPGVMADSATYFLCNDVEVKDWMQIGSMKSPFKGKFIGNGHCVTGIDFYIVTDSAPESHWGKDIIVKDRRDILQKEIREISIEEMKDMFEQVGEDALNQLLNEYEDFPSTGKLQEIENLNCCIFSLDQLDKKEHHIFLNGSWNETTIPFQHIIIECNDYNTSYLLLTVADINFDGTDDLLLLESYSTGCNYYGFIWNKDFNDFENYPSFPSVLHRLELTEKRIISRWRTGGEEGIVVYGLVDDQYTVIQELLLETMFDEEHQIYQLLSYYEMGKLVAAHIVTNGSVEAGQLYPELNYWTKG